MLQAISSGCWSLVSGAKDQVDTKNIKLMFQLSSMRNRPQQSNVARSRGREESTAQKNKPSESSIAIPSSTLPSQTNSKTYIHTPSKILRQPRHRRNVDVSGIDDVMHGSHYDDAPIYSRRPVHSLRRHRRSDREESEDVRNDDVGPGAQVEAHAVAACGPAAGEQGFVTETLV